MRKPVKYLLRILLSAAFLLLGALCSVYLPAVQRYAKGKIVEYAERATGVKADIGTLSLKFPLRLRLEKIFAGRSDTDTLLYIGQLGADIGLSDIWRKKISVRDLSLREACFHRKDTLTDARLQVKIETLKIGIPEIDWGKKQVRIAAFGLKKGDVLWIAGKQVAPEDTVASAPPDWSVEIQRLRLDSVRYRMSTEILPQLAAEIGDGEIVNAAVDISRQQVRADSVVVAGGTCRITTASSSGKKEKDGREWNLSRIGFRLNDIYSRGRVLQTALQDLQLTRREGGEIETMRGNIEIGEKKSELAGGYIRTPNTVVRLEAIAGKALKIDLDASLGMKDIALLWQEMPERMKTGSVQLTTSAEYRDGYLKIDRLALGMPGTFRLEGQGEMGSLQDWKALTGNFSLRGQIDRSPWITGLLPEKMTLPPRMKIALDVKADGGIITPVLRIGQKNGYIRATGSYSLPEEKYGLHLRADTFPLADFLPADSLGILTATADIEGRGLSWTQADAHGVIDIQALEYRRHLYSDIKLAGKMAEAHIEADLLSRDPALLFGFNLRADSTDRRYTFHLTGNVEKADLRELNLSPERLTVSFRTDIGGAVIPDEYYALQANLTRLVIDNRQGSGNLGDAAIALQSDRNATTLEATSGDFRLTFRGDTLVTRLSAGFDALLTALWEQLEHRDLNMDSLRSALPRFHLDVTGRTDNIAGKYLRTRKLVFDSVAARIGASPEEGIRAEAKVIRPRIGTVDIDTLTLHVRQETGIEYDAEIVSDGGAMKNLYRVGISGKIVRDRLRVLLHQRNREKKTGVNIGADIVRGDSSITIRLIPDAPVLGYTSWTLNTGNEIRLAPDSRIEADLQLRSAGKLLSLQSGKNGGRQEPLDIVMEGIDLSALSGSIPFIPDLGGYLNTRIALALDDERLEARGKWNITGLRWEQNQIGDLALDLKYYGMNRREARHTLDIDLLSVPLNLVNIFIPENTVTAYGELQGQIKADGTPDSLALDGQLAFRQAAVETQFLGTRYGIDSTRIPLRQGTLRLQNFGLTAPNKKRLEITGDISLLPLNAPACDLQLRADDFQVVNVKKNETSLVYGKAYIDLDVALRGLFSALQLTGSASLLNSTSLDYVLRNSAPELRENTRDIVRFVSFNDTLLTDKDQWTNRIQTGSFSMRLLVEIEKNVGININLSEDGNNRVAIQGGGNLIYTMNPESGNGLVGKYVLNGGTVRYGIPVVGEKTFTIREGSNLEWTGNLEEPGLHITAATAVRVNVTEDNKSTRIVNFEVLIRIEGSLRQPQITFDLTAPSDQAIQTQLAAFSAEERTKQAMNLLIYGTYTAPGTVNNGASAANTLNNFVEKELNQWTRKYLKNTNLTFGIDTYNQIGADGQETKRTDYSYQFSKQLFNDKINVKVGGRISSDSDPGTSMEDNLIDDISIEYLFSKNRNLFLKAFRHTNYESVLEGEVTQTGVGIVWRKSFRKLGEIFRKKNRHRR